MKRLIIYVLLIFSFYSLFAEAESTEDTFMPNFEYNKYPIGKGYYSPKQIVSNLKQIYYKNFSKCYYKIIGHSTNLHLPIYALVLENNQNSPYALIVGQHQSEEPIGISVGFAFIKHVLKPENKNLLNNFNFVFVPTINPEGYKIFYSGQNMAKRKNNSDTNLNGVLDDNDGVDLNKNYPINWEFDKHSNPNSPYYKGKYAASENEVISMMNLYDEFNFQLAFFLHSSLSGYHSERIFFPYKHSDKISPDWFKIKNLADTLAYYLPRDYTKGNYRVHLDNTSRRGFARDYIYNRFGTYAYTIENGGKIKTKNGMFSVVFPSYNILNKIIAKNIKAISKICNAFYKYLHKIKLVSLQNLPYANKYYNISLEQNSPLRKTNKNGYIFYYNPHKYEVNFVMDNKVKIKIQKDEDNSEQIIKSPKFKVLKNDIATIFVGDDFQKFGVYDKKVSLKINNKTYYSKKTKDVHNFNFINLPEKGVLTFNNTSFYEFNYINSNATVSWCNSYNKNNFHIIYPHSSVATCFKTVYRENLKMYVKKISFDIQKQAKSSKATVNIYEKNNKLIYHKLVDVNKNSKVIDILNINIPLSSFMLIELENTGNENINILKEDYKGKKSGCNFVGYSNRIKFNGNDFAVKLTLEKH